MSESVESLLREAGIDFEDPEQGAKAVWEPFPEWGGSLSALSVELDEAGDLLINSDELDGVQLPVDTPVESEVILDIPDGEENEEDLVEVKEEPVDGEVEDGEDGGVEDGEDGEVEDEAVDVGEDDQAIDNNFRRCGVCGDVKHKKSILRHIRLIHENVKVTCDACGQQLSSEAKLLLHIEKVHGENEVSEEVKCSFCEKIFATKAKASYHETTAHKAVVENEFKCTLCPKTYKTKPNLSRHVREKHRD